MKSYIVTTLLALGISISSVSGQSYLKLFKNLDFASIEASLTNDASLKINRGDKIAGKSKVMAALKSELNAFAPTSLETKHKGSSAESDSDYLIATIYNAKKEAMRIFVHLENSDSGRKICDIKFRSK